jgi:ABC-type transport system involved in multi-copper enzyme maturation permease subunit
MSGPLTPPSTRLARRYLALLAFLTLLIAASVAAWVLGVPWVTMPLIPFVMFYSFVSGPARGDEGAVPGPLFFYDAVRLARRGRGTLLRCGYAVTLLGVLCAAWRSHFPEVPLLELGSLEGRWVAVRELPRFAQTITLALLLAQGVAVLVLTPAYLAGAVTEEKERGTLDLLFTSDLSDREIILGKLLARLLHLGCVFLAAVPVLCLTLLWGGVSAPLLLAGCVATAATLLSVGGVSVLCSVLCGKGRAALAWSYVLVTALCLVGLASPLPFVSSPVAFVLHLDQKLAGRAGAGAAGLDMTTAAHLAYLYGMVHVLVAWACVALAIRRLRVAARGPEPLGLPPAGPVSASWVVQTRVRRSVGDEDEEAARLLYGPARAPVSRPPPVGDRPLLWKEMYQGGPLAVGPPPRRLLKEVAGPWLFALLLAGACVLVVRATARDHARGLTGALNLLCCTVGVDLMAVWCAGVAFRAAGSISRERERGTLDGLLALPVERVALLRAKWLGSIFRWRGLGYGLVALWASGLALGAMHPLAVLLAALSCAVSLALLASLGLWLSLVARTTLRANVSMAVVLLLWLFGAWLAWPSVGPPVLLAGPNPGHFDWFGCNPLGAWWVAQFFWSDLAEEAAREAPRCRSLLGAVFAGLAVQVGAAGLLWLLALRRFRSTFGR